MKLDRFKRKMKRIKQQGEKYKMEQQLRDTYAEYWPNRKKKRTSTIMLIIIVVAIVAYTVASFWLQYTTGTQIDSTLSTLYYGFWATELISLTTIKNYKTRYGSDHETVDNKNEEACG